MKLSNRAADDWSGKLGCSPSEPAEPKLRMILRRREGNMSKNSATPAWADKQVFTTGEAAEICKVSQQTIIRCFDNGRLNGFRVPGSKFRRIPREALVAFMT